MYIYIYIERERERDLAVGADHPHAAHGPARHHFRVVDYSYVLSTNNTNMGNLIWGILYGRSYMRNLIWGILISEEKRKASQKRRGAQGRGEQVREEEVRGKGNLVFYLVFNTKQEVSV